MNLPDLRHAVREKLKLHTEYNTQNVKINVNEGVVELSGYVDGNDAHASVEGITRSVPGVHDVVNNLKIKNLSTTGVQGIHLS